MTCEALTPALFDYHFGASPPAEREQVEAHLRACPACLDAFFALKRDVELAPEEAPSPAARARIRRSVEEALRVRSEAPPRWRWWERPLAFGVAGAALALAATFAHLPWVGPGAAPRGLERATSGRPHAP